MGCHKYSIAMAMGKTRLHWVLSMRLSLPFRGRAAATWVILVPVWGLYLCLGIVFIGSPDEWSTL